MYNSCTYILTHNDRESPELYSPYIPGFTPPDSSMETLLRIQGYKKMFSKGVFAYPSLKKEG